MSQKTAILGFSTETSLHAGTGQMQSNIDLPIQRESHTSYPCVYGSGVKGALRELAESHKFEWLYEVFGPDMQNGSEHAGALWYEETLPPNTLLYTSLIAQKSRKKESKKKADDILEHVINDLFIKNRPYLRLGGNETVGMGWCKVKVPVPFLAVKSATFLISIAARNPKDKDITATAFESLLQALETGAGSKTAVGYGYMVRKESEEKSLLNELNKKPESKPEPKEDYSDLIKKLPTAENPKQLAEHIKVLMKKEKKWKEICHAKRPNKDKDYQRTLLVMKYLK